MQGPNKHKETFAETAAEATEVGGEVAEIATDGIIETAVGTAGEFIGGAAEVAEVIGGVLGGIDGI